MMKLEFAYHKDNSTTYEDLLYFDVAESGQSKNMSKNADIVYNGERYFLSRIEFYAKSLHRKEESNEQMKLEMCLYHESYATLNSYVVVSVFLENMFTYSSSQDFFGRLIQSMVEGVSAMVPAPSAASTKPVHSFSMLNETTFSDVNYDLGAFHEKSSNLQDCQRSCQENIEWCDGVLVDAETSLCHLVSGQSTVAKKGYSLYRPIVFKTSRFDETWNPFAALPNKKSFYVYRGGFPYSSCSPKNVKEIVWIIMENKVPIHDDDYTLLLGMLQKFKLNDGSRYPIQPLNQSTLDPMVARRRVLYNDGSYVYGNERESDKFVVKCMKREQQPLNKSLVVFGSAETQELLKKAQAKKPLLTYYGTNYAQTSNAFSSVFLWLLLVLIIGCTLWFVSKRPDALMSFMLLCLAIYYIAGGVRKIVFMVLSVPLILILMFFIMLMKAFSDMGSGKESIGSAFFTFMTYAFFVAGIGVSVLLYMFLSNGNESIHRRAQFYYVKNEERYISKDKLLIIMTYADHEEKYGLEYMQVVNISLYRILPKATQEDVDDPSRTVEQKKDTYWLNVLSFYSDKLIASYNEPERTQTPLSCFISAVLQYSESGPGSQVFMFQSVDPKTSNPGVVLDFSTASLILNDQLPEVYHYLSAVAL